MTRTALLVALAATAAILGLAFTIRIDPVWTIEMRLLAWVQSWSEPGVRPFLDWVSDVTGITSRVFLLPIAAGVLWATGRRRSAIAFGTAVAVIGITATAGDFLLGQLADRVRSLPGSTENSYPSAHTYGTTLFFGAIIFLAVWHRLTPILLVPIVGVLGSLILAVGPSRIFLNMHWPADVIAGYLYGLTFLALLIILYLKLENARPFAQHGSPRTGESADPAAGVIYANAGRPSGRHPSADTLTAGHVPGDQQGQSPASNSTTARTTQHGAPHTGPGMVAGPEGEAHTAGMKPCSTHPHSQHRKPPPGSGSA